MLVRLTLCAAAAVGTAALLGGCGSSVDPGGLTSSDRNNAQLALNALEGSNIAQQLVTLSFTAGQPPAACRVHLDPTTPGTYHVYVFWVPFIGPASYTWLTMTLAKDGTRDTFHLGTAPAVIPGGLQLSDGKVVAPSLSDYNTPLSAYGPAQRRRNREAIRGHGGDTFSNPGANCQVLKNGDLRLLPN